MKSKVMTVTPPWSELLMQAAINLDDSRSFFKLRHSNTAFYVGIVYIYIFIHLSLSLYIYMYTYVYMYVRIYEAR